MSKNEADRLFYHIWSLSKLKYCHLDICFSDKTYFPNPTVISTSLKHLTIERTTCSLSTLIRLCQYTPNLKYLSSTLEDNSDQFEFSFPIISITRLKFIFICSINMLEKILQNMPNLSHLSWESYDKEIQLNEIVDSFRTKFWINEHQWFVRGHWYISDDYNQFIFCTLPYTFDSFPSFGKCILTKLSVNLIFTVSTLP
ncbi:unnamed protein product [Rotaria sp. Silwood1]|nr:unnamed protein product [Rotaria sp. Silwood1]